MTEPIREPKGELIPSIDARWQVRAFAEEMEQILRENDHKGGWLDCDVKYLQARLIEEVGEYFALVAKGSMARGESFQKELIDIANFCMMLWDRS